MATIKVTAESLSAAYLDGKKSGCVNVAGAGITSHGRHVRFIAIPKGKGRVELKGSYTIRVNGKDVRLAWAESFNRGAVEIDD